ncbi:unnamed protein product [Strongylus vulgaris]|uniref:Beta-lactamase-related domain-containing protein n=1 Tax=Strongylus vulgaris TaxID=40348 RepID=A0A3P7IY79_STRVU|nr:unnamed protein product [Strongylus vulgaris]
MKLSSQCSMNNPEHKAMEQASVLGIGNARSLAALFNLLINGKLVGEKTLAMLKQPVVNETDYVTQLRMVFGHGLMYHPSITGEYQNSNPNNRRATRAHERQKGFHFFQGEPIAGHGGYGCQEVNFDPKNGVVIAYVTNGLKVGMYDSCRIYMRLQNAVYDVIRQSQPIPSS